MFQNWRLLSFFETDRNGEKSQSASWPCLILLGFMVSQARFILSFRHRRSRNVTAHNLRVWLPVMASSKSLLLGAVEIKLDGLIVDVPPTRRTFAAIRSYLESLALKNQRILCALSVDGEPANLIEPRRSSKPFVRMDGETMSLSQVPAQLISAALQQTVNVRAQVQSAVELVLINDSRRARELWWSLAITLKEPLLTLSLLPENIFTPAAGSASAVQLHKWQLEQLGCVIRDVDDSCDAEDPAVLSDALEKRALPLLDKLHASLTLWLETILLEPETVPASAV